MSDAQRQVGPRLQLLLEMYPITQTELGDMLGVDKGAVSRYLNKGTRANRTLILLLDRIEVELHEKYSHEPE